MAGHDEDPAKTALGTPLERIMKMGTAMLEAVRTFKPPSSDGKKFEIRLGQPPLVIHLTESAATFWSPMCINCFVASLHH